MKLKKYLRKMAEIDADKLLNEKDEMYIQKMLQSSYLSLHSHKQ